jgi:hypothetical protein
MFHLSWVKNPKRERRPDVTLEAAPGIYIWGGSAPQLSKCEKYTEHHFK